MWSIRTNLNRYWSKIIRCTMLIRSDSCIVYNHFIRDFLLLLLPLLMLLFLFVWIDSTVLFHDLSSHSLYCYHSFFVYEWCGELFVLCWFFFQLLLCAVWLYADASFIFIGAASTLNECEALHIFGRNFRGKKTHKQKQRKTERKSESIRSDSQQQQSDWKSNVARFNYN